jgi:hypothetical protein
LETPQELTPKLDSVKTDPTSGFAALGSRKMIEGKWTGRINFNPAQAYEIIVRGAAFEFGEIGHL